LVISGNYWLDYFYKIAGNSAYAFTPVTESSPTVMVEYSSPNTNKPLHLGHIRNNLLGYSVAEILMANGNKVIKTNLVNDRGIHICKSMLAWQKWGNGETPHSTLDPVCKKGDHLVGKYYVEFDKHLKAEIETKVLNNREREEASSKSELMREAQEMLNKWEKGDSEVVALWNKMNDWVYSGFKETYSMLGVSFDKTYYESKTYLLGKELVEFGLNKVDAHSGKKVFFKKEDGSVRIDLTQDGLDEKVLLRSDGTSVYMTQDLGTAVERFKEFPKLSKLIYTVGNEQEYHFRVLFLILRKLGFEWAKECFHLSYGMVELPDGKMKSREGTVVDADDLIKLMIDTAREMTLELGKTEGLENSEAEQLYKTIGLGALKYFILKVDPKKTMLFNPKESIDFNGNTGPFIQYTYARSRSIVRKAVSLNIEQSRPSVPQLLNASMDKKSRALIKLLSEFPKVISDAGKEYNPGLIANYVYELSREFNQFYHDIPILKEEHIGLRDFRLVLTNKVAEVIKAGMLLLGIEVPERM
jgi:arginyl-tRNA synthetase